MVTIQMGMPSNVTIFSPFLKFYSSGYVPLHMKHWSHLIFFSFHVDLPFIYTGAFLNEPGSNSVCIERQVTKFVLNCQRRLKERKKQSKRTAS